MGDTNVISFEGTRRKVAARKRLREKAKREEQEQYVLVPLYWAFLLWHRLSVDDVDREMRKVLARALLGTLQQAIAGDASSTVILPREVQRYEDSDLVLLAKARDASEAETAKKVSEWECLATEQPDMGTPEALLESGILTDADIQAAREAVEREIMEDDQRARAEAPPPQPAAVRTKRPPRPPRTRW